MTTSAVGVVLGYQSFALSLPDVGSWPDWLAGVGAVTALLWARKAARAAAETNRAQQAQLDAIQRDEREKQANGVAVWIDVGAGGTARYIVSNKSGQPVYNFAVWWNDSTTRCRPRFCPVVPPGQWWMFESVPMFAADEPFGPTRYDQHPVAYSFSDQTQNAWVRELNGTLVNRVRDPDPLDLVSPLYPHVQDRLWTERPRR